MNSLVLLSSISVLQTLAFERLGEVKYNFFCETEQESIWWKSTEEVSMTSYSTDNCFYECEQMALKLDGEGYFDGGGEPLCCNYISWLDGKYSCDLMRGDKVGSLNPYST